MEKHHGRLETRQVWTLAVDPEKIGFYGAAQIVRLRRHFEYLGKDKESEDISLAITSLPAQADATTNAETLLQVARAHWSIENGIHYVRDRSYDEDRCQVRDPNSAQILATLRSMARFLAKNGAHRPTTAHQDTTPALQRFCSANRSRAIQWMCSARSPF